MHTYDGTQYCCGWTIKWKFPLEAFVRDGESAGIGRFVGLDKETNKVACQLWFVDPGFKAELGEGFSIQVDPQTKEIRGQTIKKQGAKGDVIPFFSID